MINANELRIGNKVKCKVSNDAGIYEVKGIDGYKIVAKKGKSDVPDYERTIRIWGGARDNELYVESQLAGIPLTPEILEKCGFEVKGGYAYAAEVKNWRMKIYRNEGGSYNWAISNWNVIELKHLHQLQNLFYSLTGTELEIQF